VMVLVHTVMAGVGRRSIQVDEVIGLAQPPSPPLPLPPIPPTYLPCRPNKRARSGEMAVSKSVVRGVEIAGRSRREVTKSSRPLFRLREGARAIFMVVVARAGIDHFGS
jgi:hypothetical protein